MTQAIPGYTFGDVANGPITSAEFETMKQSVLFGEDDIRLLRSSLPLVEHRIEEILDVWYGFVGANPHLLASFTDPQGNPIPEYLERVRKRFGRWIVDTARANYDQDWLHYQHEIGLRHHRERKNVTDGANSTPIVPFRDLFALVFPITATLKPFLADSDRSSDEVEGMYSAWLKSCLLQVTLWSHPYVKDGDF
ncbi:MAG: protogloblin ApPgb [Candidatus Eisenbacteria bacterium]|uniref:Protogloblin ApPgb n=1 Tax=Eiseniibacteriota bacterium TaxID=2212470 RepID=A0A956NAL7_UNCEI|nr:protogloblin ApPgb [Candidatus Eisenbacteria bacterium]MCB9465612.1 protogloblin ApPgb [Candidatus Eisenbacteria bacterium]